VSAPGTPPTGRFAEPNNGTSTTTTNEGNVAGNINTRYDRGMNLAVATFPASHGAPDINVSLVRQSSANTQREGGTRTEVNTTTTNGNTVQTSGEASRRADVGGPGKPATGGIANGREGTSTDSTATTSGETARKADVGGPGNPPTGASGTISGNNGAGNTGAAANLTAGDWKVDLPNTVTTERLQRDLAMHLDEVDRMKDQWPADSTEAYRMVAHHIFMALYDVNPTNAAK
jgi:hypothetical protein